MYAKSLDEEAAAEWLDEVLSTNGTTNGTANKAVTTTAKTSASKSKTKAGAAA
jgi:hypothetical protein